MKGLPEDAVARDPEDADFYAKALELFACGAVGRDDMEELDFGAEIRDRAKGQVSLYASARRLDRAVHTDLSWRPSCRLLVTKEAWTDYPD